MNKLISVGLLTFFFFSITLYFKTHSTKHATQSSAYADDGRQAGDTAQQDPAIAEESSVKKDSNNYTKQRTALAERVEEDNWQREAFDSEVEYYLPNELIVMVDPSVDINVAIADIDSAMPGIGLVVMDDELKLLQLTSERALNQETIDSLLQSGTILTAEKNYMVSLKQQSNLLKRYAVATDPSENKPDVIPLGAYPVKVCFIDTGVQVEHEAFLGLSFTGVEIINGKIRKRFLDEHGHGTSMVDITHASMMMTNNIGPSNYNDNNNGNSGGNQLNTPLDICMVKVFDSSGYARLSDIILGALWAKRQNPNIINFSLGLGFHSNILQRVVKLMNDNEIIVIAAAGNSGFEGSLFPAAYDNVLSVGSHDDGFGKSKFSNWGSSVDIFAPGNYLLAATYHPELNNTYNTFSGTSISSAVVSGLLGNLISHGGANDLALKSFNESIYSVKTDEYRDQINVLNIEKLLDLNRTRFIVAEKNKSLRLPRMSDTLRLSFVIDNLAEQSEQVSIQLNAQHDDENMVIAERDVAFNNGRLDIKFEIAPEDVRQLVPLYSEIARSVRYHILVNGLPVKGSELRVVYTHDQIATGDIVEFSLSPLNVFDQQVAKTMRVHYANKGNLPLSNLTFDLYAIDAIHEGLPDGERTHLGTFKTNNTIMPEAVAQLEFQLDDFVFPARHVTFEINARRGNELISTFLQEVSYGSTNGEAMPLYSQARHRELIPKAVELLRKQGINIPDLHDSNSPFLGNVNTFYNWPKIGLPTSKISTEGFYDNNFKAEVQKNHAGFDYKLIAGVHDSDGVDVVFNYSFEDNFDSHFWIDDTFDDDGLNSLGKNHHSALTKMKILLNGPASSEHGDDSVLKYGAIEHYKQGHKAGAWYLLGHALHSLQDLSNPSHVDNNEHGVYGATYHNWIDRTGHQYWNADSAIAKGGFINPYQPQALGEPVRFLAYSTQQISGVFPWNSTVTGYWGRDGNRNLGGEGNTYSSYMYPLLSSLASHPSKQWHVNKDEVYDSKWWVKECQRVDWVGLGEKRRDCWDGNGHIDYDNTDDDGSNSDGDMYAIGQSNYVHAIQATAGLIYYFAKETGQIQ